MWCSEGTASGFSDDEAWEAWASEVPSYEAASDLWRSFRLEPTSYEDCDDSWEEATLFSYEDRSVSWERATMSLGGAAEPCRVTENLSAKKSFIRSCSDSSTWWLRESWCCILRTTFSEVILIRLTISDMTLRIRSSSGSSTLSNESSTSFANERIFSQRMSRKFSTINNWILQDHYAKLLQQTQKILSSHVESIFLGSIKQRFVEQRFIILVRSTAWGIAEPRQSMINSWPECSYERQRRLDFGLRQKKIFRGRFEACHYSYELQGKMSQITREQSICIPSSGTTYLRFRCVTQLVCSCFCTTVMSLLETGNADGVKHLVDPF